MRDEDDEYNNGIIKIYVDNHTRYSLLSLTLCMIVIIVWMYINAVYNHCCCIRDIPVGSWKIFTDARSSGACHCPRMCDLELSVSRQLCAICGQLIQRLDEFYVLSNDSMAAKNPKRKW